MTRLSGALSAVLDWSLISTWRQIALVSFVALLVLLPGLTALPVTDRDEARFVQAAKQMLETGDLVDIRFQDKPRWKKPVGIYWLQAASAQAFDGGVQADIWAYRIPSALAAWLTALLTLWAARPLIGRRGALVAGLMMATTLLIVAEGHIAKTDAALTASAAAALGGLAHIFFGQGGRGAALTFWLAIAASILLKGPIVPVIALAALAALWWRRETRQHLKRLGALWGLPLVVILIAPWLIAIWQVSDGAFFTQSLGDDLAAKLASGKERHWGPPGLYLGIVWITLWPWAALIPAAAGRLWADRRAGWLVFLAAWILPFWLLLEIVPTKLPHYVLPLYPALVIALAAGASATTPPGCWARRTGAALVAVPGLIVAIGILALPLGVGMIADKAGLEGLLPGAISWPAILLAAIAAFACLTAARAALAGRPKAQIGASLIAAMALYPAILQFALPALPTAFPSPHLAALIKQYRACASGPAYSVGYHEPSLVFLTETAIRIAKPEAAIEALANDAGAMVLLEDRWRKILGEIPPAVSRGTISYFNVNRGKFATARLLTPDDPRWAACGG